ncbi:helix-turn-helix transcriptional regulator [Anaerostipes sp.]|uniref:helix-turn-helix transcriptional regulator n=1 Tax=Anaerostipes sp. TaxID=1872530 RepID=UPI0025C43F41|nr:helix-turn-helix transcriptional regulator [Anaerostipes sp.]MBS7007036.1 helix-turn-helix transcriptional regulator [Anaerostipes sp.]
MGIFRDIDVGNIARNIKEYRLKEGMNQKEFAKSIEMNYQNYSQMERGLYSPSLNKLMEICKTLQITPNDLLLDQRSYEDLKKEIFDKLDTSFTDMVGFMKIVEEQRVKIEMAELENNWDEAEAELDVMLFWFIKNYKDKKDLADILYHRYVVEKIEKASENMYKEMKEKTIQTRANHK